MSGRRLIICLALALVGCAAVPPPPAAPPPATPTVEYDNEMRDYGVPPTSAIRSNDFDAPTPIAVAGARTITTMQLKDLLASPTPPLLIDVLSGQATSLPGAVALPDAGLGSSLDDNIQASVGATMRRLTGGDKARPIVVFCLSRICWLSHNAAIRLVAMGYSRVLWYRGGRNAWMDAGLPFTPVRTSSRPVAF